LAELVQTVEDRGAGSSLPPIHNDLAIDPVEGGHDTFTRQLAQNLRSSHGAEDHPLRTAVEPVESSLNRTDATTHPARVSSDQLGDHLAIRTPPESGIEIDHGKVSGNGEALGNCQRVAGFESPFATSNELNGLSVHDVY